MRSPRATFLALGVLAAGALAVGLVLALGWSAAAAGIVAANVVTFALYAADKACAAWGPPHGSRAGVRVPEAALLGLAALGGAAGAWSAMLVLRHKTRKARFAWGVPVLLALEVAGGWWVGRRWPGILRPGAPATRGARGGR